MTTKSNPSGEVTYFLVQYVPEPFRREATNIGVIATDGNRTGARFFAEPDGDGKVRLVLAKRRVRYPKIYSKWVRFWRRELVRGFTGIKDILSEPQINFRIVEGGVATEIGADFMDEIVQNLYLQLVDERLDRRPEIQRRHSQRLESSIRDELKHIGISRKGIGVNHPVVPGGSISGACTEHYPSFRQENGRPYVMQALGFSASDSTKRISERAGATAFMFGDIKQAHDDAVRIAIVQALPDADMAALARAEKMLLSSSDQVVHWDSDIERKNFLDDRFSVAQSA